jgi:hypothetical protein
MGATKTSLASTLNAHFITADGTKAMEENNLDAFLAAREAALRDALSTRLLKR